MAMPLRCHIMKILAKQPEGLTPSEIYDRIDPVYKGERQCSPANIDVQLVSMKGSGLVDVGDAFLDDESKLVVRYVFTEYGYTTAEKWFPAVIAG